MQLYEYILGTDEVPLIDCNLSLIMDFYQLDSDGFSLPVMPPIRRGLGPRRAT